MRDRGRKVIGDATGGNDAAGKDVLPEGRRGHALLDVARERRGRASGAADAEKGCGAKDTFRSLFC